MVSLIDYVNLHESEMQVRREEVLSSMDLTYPILDSHSSMALVWYQTWYITSKAISSYIKENDLPKSEIISLNVLLTMNKKEMNRLERSYPDIMKHPLYLS